MPDAMEITKNIPLEGSDGRLMGTDIFYTRGMGRRPVVIYVHGFNGFKDWGNFDLIAAQFAQRGYAFVKMNLSHNGTTLEHPEDFIDTEAFGHNNYSKELYDVQCVIDWVASADNPHAEYIDAGKIILLGHSRGGAVALIKSAEDQRVKAVITWASVSACKTPWGNMPDAKLTQWKDEGVMYYTNKRTGQKLPMYYQLYEDYIANEERLDIRRAVQSLSIPVLICHGTADPAVPFSNALLLKEWQPAAALFPVESDHVFGRTHPWLQQQLPAAMQAVVDRSLSFLDNVYQGNNSTLL